MVGMKTFRNRIENHCHKWSRSVNGEIYKLLRMKLVAKYARGKHKVRESGFPALCHNATLKKTWCKHISPQYDSFLWEWGFTSKGCLSNNSSLSRGLQKSPEPRTRLRPLRLTLSWVCQERSWMASSGSVKKKKKREKQVFPSGSFCTPAPQRC